MMDREEKLRTILEDDRVRELEMQNRLMMVNQLLDTAGLPENIVDDDFQGGLVELGEEEVLVYDLDVPPNRAFVAEYIANDWYPGVEYDIIVDGDRILGTVEREIAETDNPANIRFLARESVQWYASNNSVHSEEDRNLGIVTGGKFVPASVYDELQSMLRELGGFPFDPSSPEFITID